MRRATLGFPNRNAGGLPPGRMSQMGGQQDRRSSVFPAGGNGRRSSVMSTTSRAGSSRRGTMQSSKDPRPRNDKAFMAQCIKLILEYLMEEGYPEPISTKILSNPTSKDFQNIFSFIVNKILPFAFHKRFDEDVPFVLKFLRYPFTLSKSALTAVGSPHTWPTLLSVLYWLYELLKYGGHVAKVREAETPTFAEGRQLVFHEDLVKSYSDFLEGVDDEEEMNRQIEAKFAERSAQNLAEVETLRETGRLRVEELESLRSNPSPFEEATETIESHTNNIKKWSMFLEVMENNQQEVEKRVQNKNKELDEQHTTFGTLKEEQLRLDSVLDAQEKNSINAEEINHKRAELKRALEQALSEDKLADTEWAAASDNFDRMQSHLKDLHRQHDQSAQQLMSDLRKLAGAPSLDLRVRLIDGPAGESVLSADVEGSIIPALRQSNELFGTEILRQKDDELQQQVTLDDVEVRLAQTREENKRRQMRFSRDEADYEAGKERLAGMRERRARDGEEGEREIARLQRECLERIAEGKKSVDHFAEQYANLSSHFDEEKERVALMVLEDLRIAQERKQKNVQIIFELGRDSGRGAMSGRALR